MMVRLNPEDVFIGQDLVPMNRTMTQEKINIYVSAAEDYNPIHVDPQFAQGTPFKSTIAPGFQFLAYISEMMIRDFGGKWVTGGVMEVRLMRPVFPGDRLKIGGQVVEKHRGPEQMSIKCNVWIKNHKNETVVDGYTTIGF